MNDDHLNVLEGAARAYCASTGQDPDRQVAVEAPRGGLILPGRQRLRTRPVWKVIAEELLDLQLRLHALAIAQREAQRRQEQPKLQ